MDGHPHHFQHHQFHPFQVVQQQQPQHQQVALIHPQTQQQQQLITSPISVHVDGGDRFPQWSHQETTELLAIRAELDRTFMETKRNKQLWEDLAAQMQEKGHNRSAEQCKCKWKNLVTRYKGCETMEVESMRQQFPFYNEVQAIFASRVQRMTWTEAADNSGAAPSSGGSKKKATKAISSDDEDLDLLDQEIDHDVERSGSIFRKKKKLMRIGSGSTSGTGGGNVSNVKEVLDEFMRQQMQLDMQWRDEMNARENERRIKEMEWRQTMEALENERIEMMTRWRESEEQRRIRDEARAENRDAVFTALLDRLRRGNI